MFTFRVHIFPQTHLATLEFLLHALKDVNKTSHFCDKRNISQFQPPAAKIISLPLILRHKINLKGNELFHLRFQCGLSYSKNMFALNKPVDFR